LRIFSENFKYPVKNHYFEKTETGHFPNISGFINDDFIDGLTDDGTDFREV